MTVSRNSGKNPIPKTQSLALKEAGIQDIQAFNKNKKMNNSQGGRERFNGRRAVNKNNFTQEIFLIFFIVRVRF
jgi:hypothetical protein